MGRSQELYVKAKKLIPGATQLLSKRGEMFLPENWPSYYKKAKGCEVWDLDDKHYYDLSIMGIGSCVLGYANDEVNKAVKEAIDNGNMSTLNCYEEVELAQKLTELHPWAQMARFARSGGEAGAIAVRIARAASNKDKVAFCGYHGWHDWYLSANLASGGNLDGQLLPGLEPKGVPKALRNTSLPFHYGKIEELKKHVDNNKGEIGVIITEVSRHHQPDVEFLKQVKKIAQDIGAVLVFDEISSGFRINTGGLHALYGVEPDMLILGKAMGNGYPISAIIGKEKVMQAAQETFISSTYWTERVGFVAALTTIKIYERDKIGQYVTQMGEYVVEGLTRLFKKHGLKMEMEGLIAHPVVVIKEQNPLAVKTLYTQEMLKKGFLASNVVYISKAHTKAIVDKFLEASDEVLGRIAKAIKEGKIESQLEGPICHGGFKRLS
jgi:glutamate-1-semialdehyde aminotransferase